MTRREPDPEQTRYDFLAEQEAETRRMLPGQIVRWSIAFGLLFAFVFFFFWWSGSAIHFGAARVSERPVPTWKVGGIIRDDVTGEAVPWAVVRDTPDGRPPFFQTNSDPQGRFELMTLAEPHRVLVEATGYRTRSVSVGRQWFLWWPSGKEELEIRLIPE